MTKLLICSDTHRSVDPIVNEIKKHDDIDQIIHLGDHTADAKMVERMTGIYTLMVHGNNDTGDYDIPDEMIITVEGHRVFITHGHMFYQFDRVNRITQHANVRGCEIALFGHTHVFETGEMNNVTYINPGSMYKPKGDGQRSYVILTLEEGQDPIINRVIVPEENVKIYKGKSS